MITIMIMRRATILILAAWRADVPSRRVNRVAKTAVEDARPPGEVDIMRISVRRVRLQNIALAPNSEARIQELCRLSARSVEFIIKAPESSGTARAAGLRHF
jgi:hypothetical protein